MSNVVKLRNPAIDMEVLLFAMKCQDKNVEVFQNKSATMNQDNSARMFQHNSA